MNSLLNYTKPNQVVPMTQTQTKCMMLEVFGDVTPFREAIKEQPEIGKNFAVQLFTKRADAYKMDCTIHALFFILEMCETPAQIVMWMCTFYRIQQLEKVSIVTTSHIAKFFPVGLPSEDSMRELWDSQKCSHEEAPLGNKMDDFNNWQISKEEVANVG